MSTYNATINRVFSNNVISDLVTKGKNDVYDYVVKRYIKDSRGKTNGQLISEIYKYMGKSHRNEYYYVNTLLNKLLVGIHNVNTTTALTQVRIANHIADFVMINGEGCVYEIKSNLDNMVRLKEQLSDYYKAFSKVSVLVSEKERKNAIAILKELGSMGEAVGIYVLSDSNRIFSKTISREPKGYNEYLDYSCLFALMRKKEYESVVFSYYHELPSVAPVFYYKECLKKFSEIPILEAQRMVFQQLKKRNRISKEEFESVPLELKSAVYFSPLAKNIDGITSFCSRPYQEVCICISHT